MRPVTENVVELAAYKRIKAERYRLAVYGLTGKAFRALWAAQNGGCGICAVPLDTLTGKQLHVDHDHKTGKVRGLLCNSCNTALGRFKDSTEMLAKAIGYLKNVGSEVADARKRA